MVEEHVEQEIGNAREIHEGGEYVRCRFSGIDLQETRIRDVRFEGCEFRSIDASLCEFRDCAFRDCCWRRSKLVGVDWSVASWPDFHIPAGLSFIECKLDFSSFAGVDLGGAMFLGCDMEDVSLAECDLQQTVFAGSNLTRCDFRGADLRNADLAGATNYAIDPQVTRLSGCRVSYPDAEIFLRSLGLTVAEPPDWRALAPPDPDG